MLNQSQILTALHLLPCDVFEEQSRSQDLYPAQSGRTIRLLVEAIERASAGERVLFLCASYQEINIVKQQLADFTALLSLVEPLDILVGYRSTVCAGGSAPTTRPHIPSIAQGRFVLQDHAVELLRTA